jgi:quinoprotein glucose dehydrogenase
MRPWLLVLSFALAGLSCSSPDARTAPSAGYDTWSFYGGTQEQIRYSRLSQITPENVSQLQVAWTYDTGDASERSEMQSTPIVADGVLYSISPKLRMFALNAATGEELWSFSPPSDRPLNGNRARGVMYWTDGQQARIYAAAGSRFYSLDAKTGKPDQAFGDGGSIDLRDGLGRPAEPLSVTLNTPGVVYNDLLIIGSTVSERLPAAPGDIRAFDARTGELRWQFHTIPHPGEPGYETWPPDGWQRLGGANSWPGMSLDAARGLVFANTGSASFDFYGGNRHGDNLYANSLLCLDAATGELQWHFQFVKHDVWDRDSPAPPSLVTVLRDGKLIDAVAQATKSGYVFVFNRETGESLFPLQEIEVPQSSIPGEKLAATQVLPTAPPPFARRVVDESTITNRTPEAHAAALEILQKFKVGPEFTPPTMEGTIVLPGYDGAAEWGGQAFDPETGLYYVNSNEMAWTIGLDEVESTPRPAASALYTQSCGGCHGADLAGVSDFPPLTGLSERYSADQVATVVREGFGRMPSFGHLGETAVSAIADYVLTGEDTLVELDPTAPSHELPYSHDGYDRLVDPDGYPILTPPWGTLSAINLDTGTIEWQIPFGEYPELVEELGTTGSQNYGGPIVTRNGLLFIGATLYDRKFRAFNKATGQLLWETTLPNSNSATPAMYEVNGRQYIALSAGGGKGGTPSGGNIIAFALPE